MKSQALVLALLALCACRAARSDGETDVERVEYDLRFEGNRSMPEGALEDVVVDNLVDFERFGYRKSAIDDAAFSVESHYQAAGFPFAVATYELEEHEDGSLSAVIRIDEGPRTRLGRVSFSGNSIFGRRELADLIGGPTKLLGEVKYFVQSELEAARGAITSNYLGVGKLLVRVSEPHVTFSEDRRLATASFEIEEGPTFTVSEIRFEGSTSFTDEQLRSALPVGLGETYVTQLDRRIRAAVVEFLGEAGYPDASASVSRSLDHEQGSAALVVQVEEGMQVTVGSIRVVGQKRTREALVRSRLEAEVGKPFTPERERDSFKNLFTTGLFSRIRLDLEGEGPERELLVSVVENPSQEIFLEPGWGSYELARLKAGYRNRNLFGTGRGFRTEGVAAVRHQEVEVGVSDPFLFGADVFADASAQVLQREEPSFTRIKAGIDLTVTREWSQSFETGVSYDFERSKARDVDVTDPAALAALTDVDISAVEVLARYDTRDSPLLPTDGNAARISLQWGDQVLGSELDFLRGRYSEAHFWRLRPSTVLALSLRTGVIVPTHDTDEIPLQERFFNGGESTVRSFDQDELGPVDAGNEPLGGEAFTTLSGEIREHLFGNLAGALFADMGNVVPNYEDYFDFADFRSGFGFGIRYMLPIGPLRLDFAWNPHPKGKEDGFLVHFSVGMPF